MECESYKGKKKRNNSNKKEIAINDDLSVTKLLGFLLRLQHHTSIRTQGCQMIL